MSSVNSLLRAFHPGRSAPQVFGADLVTKPWRMGHLSAVSLFVCVMRSCPKLITAGIIRPTPIPVSLRSGHLLRPHPLVELLGGDVAERQRRSLETRSFLVGFLGDLRRLLIADVGIQRGHGHERIA